MFFTAPLNSEEEEKCNVSLSSLSGQNNTLYRRICPQGDLCLPLATPGGQGPVTSHFGGYSPHSFSSVESSPVPGNFLWPWK